MSPKSSSRIDFSLFGDGEGEDEYDPSVCEYEDEDEDEYEDEDEDEELGIKGYSPGEPGHLHPVIDDLSDESLKKNAERYAHYKDYARMALENFKDDYGKQYEVVDVLAAKANFLCDFYITFTAKQKDAAKDDHDAKDDDDVVKMFRAILYRGADEMEAKDCMIAPDVHAI